MKKQVIEQIKKLQKNGKKVEHTRIIRKVFLTKRTNQMLITIPWNNGIVPGDFVEIKLVK